ncbi:unnamed protein product [Aphanomyces euteiches]|nr:hypothetical protein AeRB84_013264 [Aphanomyces euteiches]
MRLLTPLALAASAVVVFHQPNQDSPAMLAHPSIDSAVNVHRALQDNGFQKRTHGRRLLSKNRKLAEGKYEKKYRARGETCGAFCGGAAGMAAGAAVGSASLGAILGFGHIAGAVTGGISGTAAGATFGKMAAGKYGAKVGRAKDERLAASGGGQPAANSRSQRQSPSQIARSTNVQFTPQRSARRGPRL